MAIVDAHFHVWRQADLPWLSGPMQPRIFGPYEAIRRDYLMSEYLEDIAGTGVTKAVYVQANWPVDKAAEEASWIESLIAETGWPHALVAYADMTVPDVRPALDRLMRHPHLRGIRHQFHWHENPSYRFAPEADLCRAAQVQRNVARLAEYGLVFELQVFDGQMAGAAELAAACPDVTFVLQHAGMLEDLSEQGRTKWRRALLQLARCQNVVSKLSGFGTFQHRLDRELIQWISTETLAMFGAHRCLWGSNYPIEKLWTSYAALVEAHRTAAGGLGASEQSAIFNETAARIYRLT
jgi:predicted TIM-barrel fold metal-dependent hydrolase